MLSRQLRLYTFTLEINLMLHSQVNMCTPMRPCIYHKEHCPCAPGDIYSLFMKAKTKTQYIPKSIYRRMDLL